MRHARAALTSVAIGMAVPGVAPANIILNGSFENNTNSASQYGMSNNLFNAVVSDVNAWGPLMSTDLITHGGGFGLEPVDGDWQVALRALPFVDAFSFLLSEPMVAGETYDLSFWAASNSALSGLAGRIQIGISTDGGVPDANVFLTDHIRLDQWTQYATTFVAPIDGAYLSVRPVGLDLWAHVDGFVLTPSPSAPTVFGAFALCAARRRRPAHPPAP